MTDNSRKYLLAVLLCLSIAGALWCFGFFWQVFSEAAAAVLPGPADAQDNLSLQGMFFREYVTVESECAFTEFLLSDGEKAAKGALLGYGYNTESERREGLQACIGQGGAVTRASDMPQAVRAYAFSLSRRDSAGVLWGAAALASYTGSEALPSADGGRDIFLLRAGESGLFMAGAPACLESGQLPSTPEEWEHLWRTPKKTDAKGYLLTGIRWYYAALAEKAAGEALGENRTYLLTFEGCTTPVEARLIAVSPGENGQLLAVFSSTAAPGREVEYRYCRAEVREK